MRKARLFISIIIVIIILTLLAYNANAMEEISAITIPSADVTLSFIQPGRIAGLNISEGDLVEEGQMLVSLDDAAEQAQLAQIKAQAEDTTQTDAARASLAQKKIDLEMLEWAAARSSATELEVKHARLDVELADLSLKAAVFEHEQNVKKYEEARIRIDRMGLKSPVSGRIEKIEFDIGESVNALDKVVRVVSTDPLWIDVPVPLDQGKNLVIRQEADVKFTDSGKSVKGIVIFISTVADAASSTMRVRVQIPNQSGRPAGEYVSVTFTSVRKSQQKPDDRPKKK